MKLVLVQFNAVVGDLAGNAQRIAQLARRAHGEGARVVLTPELALSGAPLGDLLLRPSFVRACHDALEALARELADCEGLHVLVGHPWLPGLPEVPGDVRAPAPPAQERADKPLNAVSVLCGGRVIATACKRGLPPDPVLDGCGHFVAADEDRSLPITLHVDGLCLTVLFGGDAFMEGALARAQASGAQALCVLDATPFGLDAAAERERRLALLARAAAMPLLYLNLLGGQDELVFDGAALALGADGEPGARAALFEEGELWIELSAAGVHPGRIAPLPGFEAQAWAALVTGLRDYIAKNGFPGAIIGLSGGMDSALVLALAVDAIGAERVRAVMMPSPYTAQISLDDARDMAARLGVRYEEIPISPLFDAFVTALAPAFRGMAADTTEENIQARVRGTLLMALSNKSGWVVLTTGNKSELATGYCTLYGDMAGGFAVIKDVYKTLVYRLARWRNAQPARRADGSMGEIIPERIITRAPSAELRPDQTDQDSLPPYEVLDAILERLVEGDESVETIVAAGYERALVERVLRLLRINEYKRRQAPVGPRITRRAFGTDWRQPITSRFRA